MMKMGFEYPLIGISPEKVEDDQKIPSWLNGWVVEDFNSMEKIDKVRAIIITNFDILKQYFNLNFTVDSFTTIELNGFARKNYT